MSKSRNELRKYIPVLDWLLNQSLKRKLFGALSALILLNGIYFYSNAKSVFELNRLILSMYDNVVMSGTYSQMAKNDFSRYCEAVQSALMAPNLKAFEEARLRVEEADTSLDENLKVVEERTLNEADKGSIRDLTKTLDKVDVQTNLLFAAFKKSAQNANSQLTAEQLVGLSRSWAENPVRQQAHQLLTDLADKIVADGYSFRLKSVERSDFIGKTSVAFAVAVILINFACMVLVALSILPRLRRLTNACAEIVAGNHSKRVTLRSNDEFGVLASSFNSMLDIIAERENQIRSQLFTTSAMVDSLAQGFLIFDRTGVCLPVFSKACVELLEAEPGGRSIADILKVEAAEREIFMDWIAVLFSGKGTFEDLAELYPLFQANSKNLTIALDYRPLSNSSGEITHIVLIATDRTREVQAKAAADKEQAFSRMVSSLLRNRTQFSRFLIEADKMIKAVAEGPSPEVFRMLHTLKGGAATFSIAPLMQLAHKAESELGKSPSIAKAQELSQGLRDEYDRTLLELFNTCAFLLDGGQLRRDFPVESLVDFYQQLQNFPGAKNLAKNFADDFLYEPISNFFVPFEDSIQELAPRLGKKMKALKVEGGSTRIFGENYASLFASFVHLFRNAIDHGIEVPAERLKAGKDPCGIISVRVNRFDREGRPWLEIRVQDDGAGVDITKLREKLGARAQGRSDFDVLQMIFEAGVSTAAQTTEISGRGVGTDAVLSSAIFLGGTAKIESAFGKGTVVTVTVPELPIPDRFSQAA